MKYDTIIVGAGSMGMASGYYLARQGKSVLLVDSFDPPHSNGSHHGETRIIRHAYGEGATYVPLALRAQKLWLELQKETRKKIFEQTGVINIGEENSPFVKEVQASANKHNLPIEVLTGSEINRRWPGFALPAHYVGCLEKTSGVLFSEACISSYKELAKSHGATLKMNSTVSNIQLENNGVAVQMKGETYRSHSLIVTAGAWASKLLKTLNLSLPLQTVRKTFSWFDDNGETYHPSKFPAFTMDVKEGMYYGFPNIDQAGVKIGRHDGGIPISIEEPIEEFGKYEEDKADVSNVLRQYFPKAGNFKQGKTCIYTNTPDGDFIIDQLPNHPHVAIACGFSGHGFKFGSVVGEILSQLIENKTMPYDLEPFSIKRFS
ncbi:monomeric sarcosine oxidase [Salirhabdus euzebyi]|uniref:Monomeric sarcosine oxidase n=1 Tax=Salirhabdus euzebyi TaxID=394506 RepID=A0A841Q709_9BACI|nr:N-methyl-L-tryptophan oxidase [Salirhabdus euzebyi]MBB6454082.1 monomeric sarcosine oxidase [Salirhabdus euzebyi]